MANIRVIIVTSNDCLPCEELKVKLVDKGVKFNEYNVDTKVGLEFIILMKEREVKLKATTPQIVLKEVDGGYEAIDQKKLFEMIDSGEISRKK